MAFYVSKPRRRVSKPNLLALLALSGCSSADFTNVRHVAAGGAPSAGMYPFGDSASGTPSATGGRSAMGGAMQGPASAGYSSVSNSGTGGIDVARAGTASQGAGTASQGAGTASQGRAGSSSTSETDAGRAGVSAAGGHLTTDASSAGMRAATGGESAGGSGPAVAGMSGMPGGGGEPIGGCNHQLLANADFEAGPGSPWQESSDWPGVTIILPASDPGLRKEGVTPHGGSYLAWLGGIPDNPYDHYEVMLTQELTIPATTAALTLSGEYLVHSEDGAEAAYDEAHLQLNVAGDVAWLARSFTNQDMGHEWKSFTAQTTELGNLRGKTVTFIAYSRTDLDGKTSFWLDDLRLQATCGR